MSIYLIIESDFGTGYLVKIVDSLDKARVIQAEKELQNNKDWIKYRIEEWEVE